MSYVYRNQRPFVFTEEGQVMFLKIRDRARELIGESGAATCEKIISTCTGLNWNMLACVDRLVELGELLKVPNPHSGAGQDEIYILPFKSA